MRRDESPNILHLNLKRYYIPPRTPLDLIQVSRNRHDMSLRRDRLLIPLLPRAEETPHRRRLELGSGRGAAGGRDAEAARERVRAGGDPRQFDAGARGDPVCVDDCLAEVAGERHDLRAALLCT